MSDDEIVAAVARAFPCFGGGDERYRISRAAALAEGAPVFALGVPVRDVVAFVREKLESDY